MPNLTLRSFISGELDPALHYHADLERWVTGLKTCSNFIVRPQGGVHNRPGTRYIGEVKDSSKKAFLIEFQFNIEQTYILEFGDLIMRVIKDGAYVMDGGSPYELVTPYTEDEIFDLNFAQNLTAITITHRNHAVRSLARVADAIWAFGVITFQPFVAIPPGIVTIEVGTGGGSNQKTYKYVVTNVNVGGVESLPSTESSITTTTGSLSDTKGIQVSWGAADLADYYKIYKDTANGTGVYGFIGESKNILFTDYNIAPDISRTPPQENTPVSSTNNYPGAVNYYQQRLILANTYNNPHIMHATQIGVYDSLQYHIPGRDDDSIEYEIRSRQVNEIRHIVAIEDLILLTADTEQRVTDGSNFVLTPSTIGAKPQSYNGASKVRPAIVDDDILFVQEKGNQVRNLGYSTAAAKYTGNDLSIMAEHLFKNKTVVDIAYSEHPYGVLWCVMNDGILLGLTYQPTHKIWAWHQHSTDGLYESVAVISEGNRDATYFVIKRTIDGNTVRYVERLEPRYTDSAENAFFVDSGLSYDGSPTTAISGLGHLEGETVIVLADGNVIRDLVVSSGAITLPNAASVVHVGLSYISDIETLGIDSNQQSTQGRKKNVSQIAIRFQDSRGGWAGPDENNLLEIKPRHDSDSYDTVSLKTNERKINIEPGWNDDGQILIRQIDPLPMSILSLTPEFDIGG